MRHFTFVLSRISANLHFLFEEVLQNLEIRTSDFEQEGEQLLNGKYRSGGQARTVTRGCAKSTQCETAARIVEWLASPSAATEVEYP
jgi:hypothetical protein